MRMRALLNRVQLLRLSECGRHVSADGRLWVHGRGKVEVRDGTRFEGGATGIELHAERGARIRIGSDCLLNAGVSIEACELVTIGDRVNLGERVKILDNSFHVLDGDRTGRPPSSPVIIEDDVVVGPRVIILPGTHLVTGTRVREGTVTNPRTDRRKGAAHDRAGETGHPGERPSLYYLFWLRLIFLVSMLVARLQLRGCALGPRVQVRWRVRAQGRERISIGRNSTFQGGLAPTQLVAREGAVLKVGESCMFNYGARIEAHSRVELGSECMCASDVVICDRPEDGRDPSPIVIEDRVWLAHGVRVLPGVRIGRGAVISAGSIVARDVPAETLVMGTPGRNIPLRLLTLQRAAE